MTPGAQEPPDPLVPLLVAYDEGLAVGHSSAPALPEEVGRRFAGARDVLHQLERLWPRADAAAAANGTAPGSSAFPLILVGERLGRFRIERELGHGGFGIVFLAFDPMLNRRLALKLPLPGTLLMPELRRRFLREARAAGSLEHPNLVPVYEADEIGPLCYIAYAYVEGPTLAAWLTDHGPVAAADAAHLVAALAAGVGFAHSRGIVHRDLKPGNILLQKDEGGRRKDEKKTRDPSDSSFLLPPSSFIPKVTDFGLAKLQNEDSDTRTVDRFGTPAYMAPEQHERRHQDVGPATDVYALGLILYEMLTGQPLFPARVDVPTVAQAKSRAADALCRLQPRPPCDLVTICLKCLDHEPHGRYPDAGALAEDLRRFLHKEPIRARHLTALRRVVRWGRRSPALVALAGALAVSLLALAAHHFPDGLREPTAGGVFVVRAEAEPLPGGSLSDEQTFYAGEIAAAVRYWEHERYDKYDQVLERLQLTPTLRGLCGFEWRYLRFRRGPSSPSKVTIGQMIHRIAYSPQGELVATGTSDGEVTLRDADTWMPVAELSPHRDRNINGVAFSPDGSLLAAGGPSFTNNVESPGFVSLWDVASRKLLHSLMGHHGRVVSIAFSPDGKRLAAASHATIAEPEGGGCHVWDVATGQTIVRVTSPQKESFYSCAFDPAKGQRFYAGGGDGRVYYGESEPAGIVHSWPAAGARSNVDQVLPFRNRPLLAFGAENGQVGLLDTATGRSTAELPCTADRVLALTLSPDEALLAAGFQDGKIRVWDTADNRLLACWEAKPCRAYPLLFTPDGSSLISGWEHNLAVWSLAEMPTARQYTTIRQDHREWEVAYSPNGRDRRTHLFDLPDNTQRPTFIDTSAIRCWTFSPDGKTLATGGEDKKVKLWQVPTGRYLLTLAEHPKPINGLAFDRSGRILVSTDQDGGIKVFSAASKEETDTDPAKR